MKTIKTINAVGYVLCHDITRIVKDVVKDAAFRKGHVISAEDIPMLLSLGKDHIYVWEKTEGMIHENEAAEFLYKISAGKNICSSPIKEGKIELIAESDGLFTVDIEKLKKINSIGQIILSSRHNNFPVKKGEKLAGLRVIPLEIDKNKLDTAEKIAQGAPVFSVLPYRPLKTGIIATGNEILYNRIKDTFTPVVIEKLNEYKSEVIGHCITGDDLERIVSSISELISNGAEMVICTGGMSVDPDDKTPLAIEKATERVVSYGSPVLPGAMFMLAYASGNIPVIGLPGGVMFAKRTVFDLVLPLLISGKSINADDIAAMGHGGFCLSCETCFYPNCAFGKGW